MDSMITTLRKHLWSLLLLVIPAVAGLIYRYTTKSTVQAAGQIPPVTRERLRQVYGKLPLSFIENRGQLDGRVAYYLHGQDKSLYFTADGITFVLASREPDPPDVPQRISWDPLSPARPRRAPIARRWAVRLEFLDSNPRVQPVGANRAPGLVSYFKGAREEWKTGLPTFSKIVYKDLWPGIDLVYSGTMQRLKYDFVVHPGADPGRIRLRYRGVDELTVNAAGQLEVSTPLGGFSDDTPYAYQQAGEQQSAVPASYRLEGEGVYGFEVGSYDRTRPLVLDPAVLVYAGFIGGSAGGDYGYGIAVDGAGNAYVTGSTPSTEATFPETVGPDLSYNGSFADAFVAKVNADGTALVFAGYIGGSGEDGGRGIAVDGSGNAYVTGYTYSSEATFPEIGGPDLTFNGVADAFVAKVNATGTMLVYCGYIGGSSDDRGYGIAVDGSGNAYVTGVTGSTQATFPEAGGPDLTFNGYVDVFVAKVNAAGTALEYAGYIGGSGDDQGYGIAVDGSGNAYVTGYTTSTEATFPETVGPDLTHNGSADAFVAKVNATGTLVYAGYIGGAGFDAGQGIAVDSSGNAYVTGGTDSTQATFPETVGPDLTHNGSADAFVLKVNADGTALVYAGFVGGSGGDYGYGIAVDGSGNAHVTGYTDSTEATFPESGGPDLTFNGSADAFVAKVTADGATLDYAGYLGGSGYDVGYSIAVGGPGQVYITGETGSSEATFPEIVGPDVTYNGGFNDAFVARISEPVAADLSITKSDSPDPVLVNNNLTYTIVVTNNGPNPAPSTTVTDVLPGSLTFVSSSTTAGSCSGTATVTCNLGALASGASATVTIVVTPTASGTITNTASVTSTAPDSTPGNNSATTTTTVLLDSSGPVIVSAVNPGPNANGWNNGDVTVSWTVTDSESGIASSSGCSTTTLTTETSGTTLTCSATNGAGMSGSASVTVRIDKTPPTLTGSRNPGPNGNGWNNSDVTVSFTCSDGGSGPGSPPPPTVVSAEGAGQSVTGACQDLAGNSASATVSGINIDKTAPTLTFGAPSPGPNAAGWNNNNVSIPFTPADNLSGVAPAPAGPLVLSNEGLMVTGTVTLTDYAGNSATYTSPAAKIDKTPPTVTGSRNPGPNGNGWNNTDVAVSFACSDGLSGVGALTPPGTTILSAEGANQAVSATCQDTAGNASAAVVGGINIDKTAPAASEVAPSPNPAQINTAVMVAAKVNGSATLLSPISGAEFNVDGGAFLPMNAADGTFDSASENVSGNLAAGFPSPGVHNVCVRGADAAGNLGDVSCMLLAVYDPDGGFVTGVGWIQSPAGAYPSNPALTGRARFGFVSRYLPGANTPSGRTEFHFQVANLNFRSSTYEWLVVAGARAQFKGTGAINNAGDYGFLLTAIDGQRPGGGGTDKFRVKIWDRATGAVVYDNQIGKDEAGNDATELDSGSIVIHSR